jgi:hypothetical protein
MRHYIIFLILLSNNIIAQPALLSWSKNFGGAAYEHAQKIITTSDGGSILIGSTNSFDGDVEGIHFATDVWVIKLDSTGESEWTKCLGGDGIDEGYDILELTTGGYVLVGKSNSQDGDVSGVHDVFQDAWIVRLDETGEIDWATSIGGNSVEEFYSVAQSGSNFIAVGLSCSNDQYISDGQGACDIFIVNVDFAGGMGAYYKYGSAWNDRAHSIAATPDGGFIVAAEIGGDGGNVSETFGQTDIWLIKTDYSGELQWQKTLGGSAMDVPRRVRVLSDGSILLCAESSSTDGDLSENNGLYDGWLVKLSATGTIQWQRSLGGPSYDGTFDAIELSNQSIVSVSEIYSPAVAGDLTPHGSTDIVMASHDINGNLLWEAWYGGSSSERPYSIAKIDDERWIIAGESNSIDGDITDPKGNDDVFVFQIGDQYIATNADFIPKKINVYPQPAKEFTNFSLPTGYTIKSYIVFDAVGQLVRSEKLSNESELSITTSELPSGIYWIQFETNKGQIQSKFCITQNPQ